MRRAKRTLSKGAGAAALAAACAVWMACALVGAAWASGTTGAGKADAEMKAAADASGQDAWSMKSDCAACHVAQAASLTPAGDAVRSEAGREEEDTAGADVADANHAEGTSAPDGSEVLSNADGEPLGASHGFASCVLCHSDEKGLEKVHKRINAASAAPKRLKKTGIDEEFCLTCHGDRSALAARTADIELLVDDNGLVVNPHDLPDNVEHGGIGCESCHYMHIEKPTEELAVSLCSSCHHEGVYECFTCHA